MGRKCYIERGYYRLYPNIFCILVAGSATCRKSTAVNIGVRFLRTISSTRIIGGKITPEQFIAEFEESRELIIGSDPPAYRTPPILVYSPELSVFLTKANYGESMIHNLTDLYDCPDEWPYKTKNSGKYLLKDVYLSILAATTPTGVNNGIPPAAMEEGFGSRTILPFQADTDKDPHLFPSKDPKIILAKLRMEDELRKQLLDISRINGEFTFTQEAIEWSESWYAQHLKAPPADKRLSGMHGRKHDHVFRVAMVLAAATGSTVIEQSQCEAALMALNNIEQLAPGAFSEMGSTPISQNIARAEILMRHFKTLQYSELLRRLNPVHADEFKLILETLIQRGQVQRDQVRHSLLIWQGE